MNKNDGSQTFSCMKCGAPYTLYPPEAGYKNAKLDPCEEGCNKPMNVICQSCHNDFKVYWCRGHFHSVVVS